MSKPIDVTKLKRTSMQSTKEEDKVIEEIKQLGRPNTRELDRPVAYGEMVELANQIADDINKMQVMFNGLSIMTQIYMYIADTHLSKEEKANAENWYKITVDANNFLVKILDDFGGIPKNELKGICDDVLSKGLPESLMKFFIYDVYKNM